MVPANKCGQPAMWRIRLPLVPQLSAIIFPATTSTNVFIQQTAVYDRGEALSDETHRWPYIYAGMQA